MVRARAKSRAGAFSLCAALLGSPAALAAGEPPQAPSPASPASPASSDTVRVSLLTFSPGAHPFLAFGHNALWVHDPRMAGDDVDLVYNFGTFAFGSPLVLVDFVRGRLRYWLSLASLRWTLETYGAEGRAVVSQELALSFDEADRLERSLLEAARPEKREYPYGYIGDNCATRVRDALDLATSGALRASLSGPGEGLTFRREIARTLGDRPLLAEAVDASIGPALDRPMTRWESAFLPDRFAEALRFAERRGPSGEASPLVLRESTLREGGRRFRMEPPPDRRAPLAALGAALGALAAWSGGRGANGASGARRARALGAVALSSGLVLGGAGLALLVLGVIHPLLRWNVNVLHASPLSLALVALGASMARGEAGSGRASLWVAALSLAASLSAALLSLSGATPQPFGAFAAFALPLWAGLCAGLGRVVVRSLHRA